MCNTFQDCVNRCGKLTETGTEGDAGYLAAAFLFCCFNGQLMQTCHYKGVGGGIGHILATKERSPYSSCDDYNQSKSMVP